MAKPKFVLKDEYNKAGKIAIRNKSLGRLIKLSKEQVVNMAKGGRLDNNQLTKLFKAESLPAPTVDKEV